MQHPEPVVGRWKLKVVPARQRRDMRCRGGQRRGARAGARTHTEGWRRFPPCTMGPLQLHKHCARLSRAPAPLGDAALVAAMCHGQQPGQTLDSPGQWARTWRFHALESRARGNLTRRNFKVQLHASLAGATARAARASHRHRRARATRPTPERGASGLRGARRQGRLISGAAA